MITLSICIVAAIAVWTARETSRIPMKDLGNKNALPVAEDEYQRLRAAAMSKA